MISLSLLLLVGVHIESNLTLAQEAPRSDLAVQYQVLLDNPQTQMVGITMSIRDIKPSERSIDFCLPAWRPGKYSILDPAGTIREMKAINAKTDELLPITKIDKATWRVQSIGASAIRISYLVYANSLGDRTRHVDDSHAFLSGSSVFLYNEDRRDQPVRVALQMPEHWNIAGGLTIDPADDRSILASNYDVLVDSPIEVGEHDRIRFDVLDTPHEIIIWPTGLQYDADQLITDFTKIIEASHTIFGSFPYERYVFLMHVGAGAGGGTEHLNSTVMQTSRAKLEGSIDNSSTYQGFLGLVAHEFFHTWNVKAFRPAGITPYDYTKENYSTLFWVAEGATSYYDELLLARTGQQKTKAYLDRLGDSINSIRDHPGASVQSLSASSFDAWIKFNKHTSDDLNSEVSFYSKGALASLYFDLALRQCSGNNASLDTVLREVYETYRWPARGYSPDQLRTIMDAQGDHDFREAFARYIDDTDPLPLETVFEVVGLELYFKAKEQEKSTDDDDDNANDESDADPSPSEEATDEISVKPFLGLNLSSSGSFATVRSVRADGPAYAAGLIVGDDIIALDGRRLKSSELDKRLKSYEVGDEITFTIMRRDQLRTINVVVAGVPDGKWTIRRLDDPTGAQKEAYASWIGQDWPNE